MARGDAEARSGTPAGPSGLPVAPPTSVWRQVALPVLVSGASVSCATACTNPLDVLKVRLQVLDPSGTPPPRGLGDALGRLLRNEGPLALWKGLTPSLARAMCYGGLRLGLYQPILGAVEGVRDGGARDGEGERPKEKTAQTRPAGFRVRTGGALEAAAKRLEHERREATERIREDSRARKHDVASKVTAGMVSGAFAAALLNPTELVKTRLMARNDVTTATEEARYERSRAGEGKGTTTHAREPLRKTPTAWSCARAIVNERGVVGLWRGAGMSVTRSAVLTASQCAAYDEAKTFVRENVSRNGEDDGAFTHFLASMLTGLITTTVTNPVDMIKTQLYMSAVSDTGSGVGSRGRGSGNGGGGGGGEKRDAAAKRVQSAIRGGAVAAFRDVLAREGPRGFMRGWTANYIRLGPQTVITFVALEQFRKLAGLTAV